jgi:hypothetical protein
MARSCFKVAVALHIGYVAFLVGQNMNSSLQMIISLAKTSSSLASAQFLAFMIVLLPALLTSGAITKINLLFQILLQINLVDLHQHFSAAAPKSFPSGQFLIPNVVFSPTSIFSFDAQLMRRGVSNFLPERVSFKGT